MSQECLLQPPDGHPGLLESSRQGVRNALLGWIPRGKPHQSRGVPGDREGHHQIVKRRAARERLGQRPEPESHAPKLGRVVVAARTGLTPRGAKKRRRAVDAALQPAAYRALHVEARRAYLEGVSQTLMTAEELLRLNLPDRRTELIRGRLVVRDPGGARHGAVAMRLGSRIAVYVDAHDLGRVYAAETDGSEALLGPGDVLDGEEVLPGFRCPLADLW